MQRKCATCGITYSRPPSQIGTFCSQRCAYDARFKGEDRKTRRVRRAPGHPLAGPTHLVAEARAVLYDKIGPEWQECHWCGAEICWAVGISGHIEGVIHADHLNGNPLDDRPENLVASCALCNTKRDWRIPDSEPFRVRANGARLRGEKRLCETCDSEFVAWETRPGRGRFCSRSCARKAPRKVSK